MTVETGETQELTFEPAFAGSIAGRPWKYAAGSDRGPGWAVAFDGDSLLATAPVAADGTFTIPGLPPGKFGVKVGSPGRRDREVHFDWGAFAHLLTALDELSPAEAAEFDVKTDVDWEGLGLTPDPWRRAARV